MYISPMDQLELLSVDLKQKMSNASAKGLSVNIDMKNRNVRIYRLTAKSDIEYKGIYDFSGKLLT
jgi:hypothetical protein